MKSRISLKSLVEKPITIFDWIAFAVIAIFCFFSLQQCDILQTGGSSFGFLNGHFLDFYDYNLKNIGYDNYLPSSYILFAIWNIPVKILGFMSKPVASAPYYVLMWYKLLPTFFFLASGYLVYKIGCVAGMGNKKAKLCGYAFLTMPIGFFSQFIFGQYDSFTIFFVLLGILFYYQKRWLLFTLFFGISMTFKYFPLLLFIPLLLLVEKRILHIIKYAALFIVPLAAEIALFLPSPAFRTGVFGFYATNNLFQMTLNTPYFSLQIVVVLWIVVSAMAFFKDVSEKDDIVKWSLFYANLVTFLIFGLSMWNPQWLLFAVPFWTLGAFLQKRMDVFMVIEILLMLFFTLFTVNFWINHVDQDLFSLGIFRHLIAGKINNFQTMRGIFRYHDLNTIYSCFSGLLLVNAIFKHPSFTSKEIDAPVDHYWSWVRVRFLAGVSIFLLPACICLVSALMSR